MVSMLVGDCQFLTYAFIRLSTGWHPPPQKKRNHKKNKKTEPINPYIYIYIYIYGEKIPKILIYGELKDRKRNTGQPWLWYWDKLKYNLSATKIPVGSFEDLAQDRNKWRTIIQNRISDFEVNHTEKLKVARSGTKVDTTQSSIFSDTPNTCSTCGLICKSLAGLKSHNRYKHSNWFCF